MQQVAERDVLRTGGAPQRAGYTLREAVALSRSHVGAQCVAALRLIAAVLGHASCIGLGHHPGMGLDQPQRVAHGSQATTTGVEGGRREGGERGAKRDGEIWNAVAERREEGEGGGGAGEGGAEMWRAVWVYAFSPEVQLVLALRYAQGFPLDSAIAEHVQVWLSIRCAQCIEAISCPRAVSSFTLS